MSTATTMLAVRDLGVSYGRVRALHGLDAVVGVGGFLLVLGPNGAGKSTFVRSIAGVVRPDRGTITLGERDITRVPAHRRVAAGVSLVPEGRGTLPGLDVGENLMLGWKAAHPSRRGSYPDAVDEVFQAFPRLKERIKQDCATLSGGEMQMLAIARALLARPDVLLLDEPSLGLAPQMIERIYAALDELNAAGLAMVVVEQKSVTLNRVPDLTLVLQAGRVADRRIDARPTEDELAALYLETQVIR